MLKDQSVRCWNRNIWWNQCQWHCSWWRNCWRHHVVRGHGIEHVGSSGSGRPRHPISLWQQWRQYLGQDEFVVSVAHVMSPQLTETCSWHCDNHEERASCRMWVLLSVYDRHFASWPFDDKISLWVLSSHKGLLIIPCMTTRVNSISGT